MKVGFCYEKENLCCDTIMIVIIFYLTRNETLLYTWLAASFFTLLYNWLLESFSGGVCVQSLRKVITKVDFFVKMVKFLMNIFENIF